MIEPLAFFLAALTLLAAPGPTNTLLAMSGAAAGLRPSLTLIGAALSGYLVSVMTLGLALGPLAKGNPLVALFLKAACAVYLVWLAIGLWREGSSTLASAQPGRFGRVFTTTLLNPKSVIFAFLIVPHLADRRLAQAAPYLAAFGAMIVCVGLAWTALGAALRLGGGQGVSGWAPRIGAGALAVFAIILGGSAWSSASAMGVLPG